MTLRQGCLWLRVSFCNTLSDVAAIRLCIRASRIIVGARCFRRLLARRGGGQDPGRRPPLCLRQQLHRDGVAIQSPAVMMLRGI